MIPPLPEAPRDLDAFLPVPGAAGVYHLAWRRRAELHRAVDTHDFLFVVAHLGTSGDKAALLRELRDAFAMPAWVGGNWDALADALSDLSWLGERPGYALMLLGGDLHRERAPEDHATLRDVLRECVAEWRGMDVPFWVFDVPAIDAPDGPDDPHALHFTPGT